MKKLQFPLCLAVTLAMVFLLNTRFGMTPPLGKFLDPFNGLWQNAESIDKAKDESYNLPGLKQEVKVSFDERMVPHVFAQNDEDMFYMQGYLTAKFRLWQMEIQTHVAAGRLSEVIGSQGLEMDRMARRGGMQFGAEAMEAYMAQDPETKKMLEAYCNGVNAYISTLSPKDYPIEYKLFDYKPEAWTPVKVALLQRNMASILSVFEFDIENTNFISKYGQEEFNKLYPDFTTGEDPIIPTGTKWDFAAADTTTLALQSNNTQPSDVRGQFAKILEKPDEMIGSNNWAANGAKTTNGQAILCNDPHLRLTLPSIWYEMHLHSPVTNVYGVTIPGALSVIIGFNDSISWGLTNGGRDVRDWYRIKFKDAAKDEYEYNGQWVKTEKKVERYIVRDSTEVIDTVIYTKFGPILFDEKFGKAESNKGLAMAWVAHQPSNEFKTFYGLSKAKNYDDYINALQYYNCPAQNFAFAARNGDIAIKHQGKFPVLDKATQQGKFISDGTTDKAEWKNYIPMEHNPTIKNPERGFISSANQHPTDSTYPYYYPGTGVYEYYRNRRINQLLAEGKNIDVEFMKKMQFDNYDVLASEALPVMLALLNQSNIPANGKEILNTLRGWDYNTNPNQVAPIYFELWWNEMRKLLWDEMANRSVPMKQPISYVTIQFLKNDSTSQFYDIAATEKKETRSDIILQSFMRLEDSVRINEFTEVAEPYAYDKSYERKDSKYTDWGTYKSTTISYLFPGVPAFSRQVYTGGTIGVVNATGPKYGPSWRMIVDEGTMKAYVVYPGGQSGNPGSAYYDNMVQDWADGKYYEANFVSTAEELKDKKLFTITFAPKK